VTCILYLGQRGTERPAQDEGESTAGSEKKNRVDLAQIKCFGLHEIAPEKELLAVRVNFRHVCYTNIIFAIRVLSEHLSWEEAV